MTYQQRRVWHFVEALSNGTLADNITTLNVPLVVTQLTVFLALGKRAGFVSFLLCLSFKSRAPLILSVSSRSGTKLGSTESSNCSVASSLWQRMLLNWFLMDTLIPFSNLANVYRPALSLPSINSLGFTRYETISWWFDLTLTVFFLPEAQQFRIVRWSVQRLYRSRSH